MVGMEPPSISMIENGEIGFSDKSLAKYAEALECTPAQLLAHDPSKPDSFWPLFEAAEMLEGADRRRAYSVIHAALGMVGSG